MCHAGVDNTTRALPLPGAAGETKVHKTEQQKEGCHHDRLADGFESWTEYRFTPKILPEAKAEKCPNTGDAPLSTSWGSPRTGNHFWSHQSTWSDLKIHRHGVEAPSGHGLAVWLN